MKNVIGLDIGTRNIKLANLALKGREVELLNFDIIQAPKTSNQNEMIDLLKLIFVNNKVESNTPVCLSVSGEKSFFKKISLKLKETKRIKEIIETELKKDMIFSLDEYIWDHTVLKYIPQEEANEILLVAAERDAVSQKIQLIKQAKGLAYSINLDILSTYNCLKFNIELSKNRLYALVDISFSKTEVLIFDDNKNIWMWTIPFGGDKFTQAIAKNLGLSFPEAEEYKKNMLFQEEAQVKSDEASSHMMKEMAMELDKTFNYFYFQTSESAAKEVTHKIDEILLSGGGSLFIGLDKFLADTLKIPTRYIYPLNRILIKDKKILANKNILNKQSSQLTTAIGLALEGLGRGDIKINLIRKTQENIFKKIIGKLFYKT